MPTALVVDDDALVRRQVERILARAQYDVTCAASVDEALTAAERVEFDVALVDDVLIEDTGLRVLARLRQTQPRCVRILITGRTDFPRIVEAVNRGEVLRVLQKPFNAHGLIALLTEARESAARTARLTTQTQQEIDRSERSMLEECLREHLLDLAIQPIVAATEQHEIVAFEALLRSRHPVLDSPAALLRVAEAHDRILDLGQEVFALAAVRLHELPSLTSLFINVHPLQFSDGERLRRDLEPLQPHAVRVTLEITERSRLNDIHDWESTIRMLADLGFSVAIDDLGAGYNSLTMLADLQPRYIKLDMALIRNIDQEPRKQRLVQLMATFADATNANLIAEGVETGEEARTLIACGTHLLQGYFFGRPTGPPKA
jgi:EAL domain-containing protein (putative c-di-GMP-specific phosphodiesterase class I)